MAAASPDQPDRLQARRWRRTLLAALGLGLAAAIPAARAELPPWVYGEQQRAAALVVELRILEVTSQAQGVRAWGRVLAVRRRGAKPGTGTVAAPPQPGTAGTTTGSDRAAAAVPSPAAVTVGSVLQLQLPAPPAPTAGPPMPGPSPLLPPRRGQRLTAWLQPGPPGSDIWLPAAGGTSFGPVMETFHDTAGP